MKRFYGFLLIVFAALALVSVQCKKEKTENPTPVTNPLAWTQMEKDTIMAGDTSLMMRVCITTILSDSLILRKKSIDVIPDSNDVYLTTLIKRMYDAVMAEGGIGIAAPQVGINRNVIWVKRSDKPGRPFEVYLNPKIVMTSMTTITFNGDGCLSVPDSSCNTIRFSAIGIEYDLLDGNHYTEVVTGSSWSNPTAVCFQHEIDHLNGILFFDRKAP